MITSDRAALRKAFALLVKTAIEGAAKPAEKVYDYQVANFGTYNPVVVVTEAGSEWKRMTTQGGVPSGHALAVHVFCLYATNDNTTISEATSEDMLSPIMAGIANVVYANQVKSGSWSSIEWMGQSTVEPVKMRGLEYRHESVLLMFR
jgi:hypothetical protein